ncbi:uncharacterized protein LOC119180817 isoform X2 [Rhipicephalus microplus]|uniref:uncharacterized protein LOC119180817 isoform X2 n=1 Tax=Rhipicephalus microplus TaxID=6941 RepID=UPI003F6C168C
MHVLISGVPLLLLAAAANAILFMPANQSSGGVVYEVHATITLESPELNVDEGTKLQYAGDLAVYPVGKDTYQARFLNFSMVTSTKTACPGCSLENLIIAPPERRYPPPRAVSDADQSELRPPVLETLIIAPPERRYPPPRAVNDAEQSPVRPPVLETLIIAPPERRYPHPRAVNDAEQSPVRPPVLETLIIAPPERRYPQLATVNDPNQSQVRPPVQETLIIAPPERRYPHPRAVNDADQSEVRPPVLETLIIAPPERRYPQLATVNDPNQSQVRPPVQETLIIAPPERRYPHPRAVNDADQSEVRPPVLETLIIAPPERRYPQLATVNDPNQSQVRPPVQETLIIAPPERRYPPLRAVNDADQSQVRPPVLETLIIAPPERTSPLRAVNDPDKSQVRPLVLQTLIIAPPERRYPSLTAVNDADQSHVRPPILETLIIAPPERGYQPPTTISDADSSQLLGYPVQFVLKSGKVVEYKMNIGAPAWINSVYQTVLALLQNQVETPLELPAVSSYYEDGVSGYCRVTYEVHSLTDLPTENRTYNMTKTKHLDDCQQRNHVDSASDTRGHPADRRKHLANNMLPLPVDDASENRPLGGTPEDLNTLKPEGTAHEVSYYLVNGRLIESATCDSLTVLPLITGPALVRAQLQLKLASHRAPPMETTHFDGKPRTSLKLNMSEMVGCLNGAAYRDLLVEPQVFTQLLDEVAEELSTFDLNIGTKKIPALMQKLVRMVSLLNTEQLKLAMPLSLLNRTSELELKEQLLRALYIQLLGNARSKSSAEMALHLVKQNILSRQEVARLFSDLSPFFMTCIDEDTRELLQDMCRSTDGLVDASLWAGTCQSP